MLMEQHKDALQAINPGKKKKRYLHLNVMDDNSL